MEGEEMGMVSIDNSFKKFDWKRERMRTGVGGRGKEFFKIEIQYVILPGSLPDLLYFGM